MDLAIAVPLPWSKPPLAQNDRRHWRQQHRDFQTAKDEARWAVRAAHPPRLAEAVVTLHYRVPDMRRRDADGPAPTLKVCLDALVAEGILPDDAWICVPSCRIQIHPPERGVPPALWLELSQLRYPPTPATAPGSFVSKDPT